MLGRSVNILASVLTAKLAVRMVPGAILDPEPAGVVMVWAPPPSQEK